MKNLPYYPEIKIESINNHSAVLYGTIRYSSVRLALIKLNRYLLASNSTLHIPRIGCDRAGGSWKVMESILKDCIEVDITVYDLK